MKDTIRQHDRIVRLIPVFITGIIATIGLSHEDESNNTLLVFISLIALIIFSWSLNKRSLPDWSLLAVGVVVGIAQPVVLGFFGVGAALITHTSPSPAASPFVGVLPWILLLALILVFRYRKYRVSGILLLAGVIVICCVLVRVKYFIYYGFSWSVLEQVLGISFWSGSTLLLPVFLVGLIFPNRGENAILFSIGTTFSWYQILIDNGFKVSEALNNPILVWLYILVIGSLFIIIGPLTFLHQSGLQKKLVYLESAIVSSVVLNIVFSGLVRGDFDLVIWLTAIPYTLSIALIPLLSFKICLATECVQKGSGVEFTTT